MRPIYQLRSHIKETLKIRAGNGQDGSEISVTFYNSPESCFMLL